jgi:hypothetical protein
LLSQLTTSVNRLGVNVMRIITMHRALEGRREL